MAIVNFEVTEVTKASGPFPVLFQKHYRPINFKPDTHHLYGRAQNHIDYRVAILDFKVSKANKVLGNIQV